MEGKWRGLLIRGGRGKGRGRVPRLLRFPPGSRGARIVTGLNHGSCILMTGSIWPVKTVTANSNGFL